MIQRREVRQRVVSERSPLLGAALLLAPTLCLVALRFASTALEEVISEDTVLMYSLHGATLIAGLIMFLRYRKVEDHEYHRSKAIRKLSRTYSREDRGLWEKGDSAIESLESKAKSPKKGRSAIREMALKKGSIGSLNQEMKEEEILDEGEVEPQIQGISTIVDEQAITNPKGPGPISRLSSWISRSLDESAKKRIERKSIKSAKPKPSNSSDMWSSPADSSLARSVSSCSSCGALNNAGTAYCSSCGNLLS